MNPKLIVVAGAASNTGKTTLLCALLRVLAQAEEWEAIKLTRGHYRSCGKDPHACCVSDLLGAEPLIRSGRAATYALGKDTGRYWDAGASNVHWIIATDQQVEAGLAQALARVRTRGVLLEGTSLLQFCTPDFALLAVRGDETKLKPSARKALLNGKIDALYCEQAEQSVPAAVRALAPALPLYTQGELPRLLELVKTRLAEHEERVSK
jgi:molybdopterin-guanine dinucleotide biosynthesis protein